MIRRGTTRPLLALATALLVLTGCSVGSNPDPDQGPGDGFERDEITSFVGTRGRDFVVDGEPFRFVGVNIYDAAATDRFSCDPSLRMSEPELRDTMTRLHDTYGATVVRFWAYQTYTASGQDYSGMDRVIAIAKELGMRVLPVLEDGPGHCTTLEEVVPKARYQDDTWFSAGYRKPYGSAPMSYRDYAKIVAEHYRDEPGILGWSLINEADTSARDDQDRSVLIEFARDMGEIVSSADPNHLITVGTQSNGARGASGPDFQAVYGLPDIDFAEVHDWGYWGSDSEPMPGADGAVLPPATAPQCQEPDAPLACTFARLPALNKPMFVGEAGIAGQDAAARKVRATQLGAKMTAAFDAGASGYLLWRVTKQATDKYDITLSSDDPLLDTLADQAVEVRRDRSVSGS